jgi:hypothetical protein
MLNQVVATTKFDETSRLTRDATPTWAFTTRGDPALVECSIDGAMPVACDDSFTPAASLADGEHTFRGASPSARRFAAPNAWREAGRDPPPQPA